MNPRLTKTPADPSQLHIRLKPASSDSYPRLVGKTILQILAVVAGILTPTIAQAGSATWDLNPTSGDWNTAVNWTPATVPNGTADTATFDLSNTTNISISANTNVNGIAFTPAATNPYFISASPGLTLTVNGTGITNNSATTQSLLTGVDGVGNLGRIFFTDSASAGASIMFVNSASVVDFAQGGETAFYNTSTAGNSTFANQAATLSRSEGGSTTFHDSSTAGNGSFTNSGGMNFDTFSAVTIFFDTSTAANGTFINDGGSASFLADGGQTAFFDTSTAANGSFTNNGATVSGGFGGATDFDDSSTAANGIFINNGGPASGVAAHGGGTTYFVRTSTAGNGTFINNAATASGAEGGVTEFGVLPNDSPSAGNGTFINNGATISDAVGGKTVFYEASTAKSATLIANSGSGGGEGGQIIFDEGSDGGRSRIALFGNGTLDISTHAAPGVTIASIEGDGDAFLGPNDLTVGSNNRSTTFSGVIQDDGFGGALTKIGSGILLLAGANTYTGDTTVNRGVLQVNGSITSNTFVNDRGTLAGTGTVYGNIANNGTVSPGDAVGTLTVNGNYTQTARSSLLINIAGANAGEFSVLDVSGIASLNGVSVLLDPVLLNGFIPRVGQSFTFLNYASLTGVFSIRHPNIPHGIGHWEVIYQGTAAILTVAPRHSSIARFR